LAASSGKIVTIPMPRTDNWQTVIVPTCNRPQALARCLRRIGPRADVIVTDDSRGNETRAMLERDFPRVHWTRGPGRGPAANRNHGAREASSEWLVFVDDDCLPADAWLPEIEKAGAGPAVDIVEGRTICPGKRDTPFEEHVENLEGGVLWSCNFAIRRAAFGRIGGFDEDFLIAGGEDMEFAWHAKQAGLRVVFAPDAVVQHPPRRVTMRMLWRRLWCLKWSVLFRLKTGARTPLWLDEPLNLLRRSRRTLFSLKADSWRAPLFHLCWQWATFPLVYPYLLWWERKFRDMMQGREHGE
jgi:GT2 family glycosyltransferase